jgi:dimethylaniline monooxygenase (N-oxide forming)
MPNKRVAIIGAGISGLAYADVLSRCGFAVVLFDHASRIGGVWARAYPGVTLQNTAAEYHLSSFPWPFVPDLHPTGEQILRYLQALVVARQFDVRLRHEVLAARAGAHGGWVLEVRRTSDEGSDNEIMSQHFDYLVISTGQYSEGKHRPALAGEAQFAGTVMTERELKDLSTWQASLHPAPPRSTIFSARHAGPFHALCLAFISPNSCFVASARH